MSKPIDQFTVKNNHQVQLLLVIHLMMTIRIITKIMYHDVA